MLKFLCTVHTLKSSLYPHASLILIQEKNLNIIWIIIQGNLNIVLNPIWIRLRTLPWHKEIITSTLWFQVHVSIEYSNYMAYPPTPSILPVQCWLFRLVLSTFLTVLIFLVPSISPSANPVVAPFPSIHLLLEPLHSLLDPSYRKACGGPWASQSCAIWSVYLINIGGYGMNGIEIVGQGDVLCLYCRWWE